MNDIFKDLQSLVGGRVASGMESIEVISSGIPSFDKMLGIGGIPRGRLVEFFGPESSGKTTMAKKICAEVHKNGGTVAWIDSEGAFDPVWAVKFGMDLDKTLLISDFGCGEEAYQLICLTIGKVDLIVTDSIAKFQPKVLRDRDREKYPKIGAAGAMNSLGLGDVFNGATFKVSGRKGPVITPKLRATKTALIFTNHIRDKIGVSWGDSFDTPGGHVLKHDASIRVGFRVKQQSRERDSEGNPIQILIGSKTKKNKLAPPLRESEFWLNFDGKIGTDLSLIVMGIEKEILEVKGAWIVGDELPKKMRRKEVEEYLESEAGSKLKERILEG